MRARLCTVLALLPLVFGGHARAAGDEPKVITLSCDGMFTPTYGDNKPADPQPLQKASLVADLNEQTVFFLGYVAPIEGVEGASIRFGGRQIVDYGGCNASDVGPDPTPRSCHSHDPLRHSLQGE
jgi:hypothetical protein